MDSITPVPQAPAPAPTPAPSPVVQTPVPAPQASSATSGGLEGPVSLFKFGWGTFTQHWKVIAPIILLPSIIAYIGQILFYTKNPVGYIVGFVVAIIAAVVSIASMPAAARAVHLVSTNPSTPVTLKGQYTFGFSLFWSMILLAIINTLASAGSFILFIIPGIIVAVYTSLYIFTFTVEGKRGFSALVESFNLIRGRWWPVFGRILFFIVVMLAFWIIVAGIQFIVGLITGTPVVPKGDEMQSMGSFVIQSIITLIVTAVIGPLSVGYMYRLYTSLKSTRTATATTSSFKGWLIGFMCAGILLPIGILVSVVLVSVNVAKSKATDASQNSNAGFAELQRQIEAMNLQNPENSDSTVPVEIPEAI